METVLKTVVQTEVKAYDPAMLREKLEGWGMSGRHFAHLVGLSQPTMWKVLHGGTQRPIVRIRIQEVLAQLEAEYAPKQLEGVEPRVRAL